MSSTSEIEKICRDRLYSLGLSLDSHYINRLQKEMEDLDSWNRYKSEDRAGQILEKIGRDGYPVSTNKSNSLVLFLTGLSSVDPVKEKRECATDVVVSGDCPDIDTDFDPRIRDWVKAHIVEIFGANKVCSIGTYATYKTRAVILDVARALGENTAEANAVTKRIEPLRAFEDETGEEQKVDQMDFDDICEHYPELKAYFEAHPEVRRHAEILRNQVKNMGTHAGGVIISDLDLQDRIPVCRDKNGQIVSTWGESGSVQELSAVGLVKYDLLGLNNLPIISDCVKLIEQTTGQHIARADIPISDREAILLGSKKDLVGIFQFENPVTKPIADKVGMESLMDIAIVTSLIRPGPMDAMIGTEKAPFAFAARKHGEPYEAPEFIRTALRETYGILVFQEDVMRLSRVLSGFTAPEANKLRKAAGKKIKELMDSIRERFVSGAQSHIDAGEITKQEVELIWEQIETFAGYGFCKAHAVTYGAITTVELWLKHNFPIQFIAALVNNTKLGKKKNGSDNILADYLNYARRREIPVLGPDINLSGDEFKVEGNSIRFALGHVKGVASAAKLIESFQPFTSMQDFYDRVKVEPKDEVEEKPEVEASEEPAPIDEADEPNGTPESDEEFKKLVVEEIAKQAKGKKATARRPNRKVVESLIAAGAFDKFGTRNEMAMEYWRLRQKKKKLPVKETVVEPVVEEEESTESLSPEDAAAAEAEAKKAKKKKDLPPDDRTDEEWQRAEFEVIGMCLSRQVLFKQYEETIRKEGWYLINEIDPTKKKVLVFGEITSIDHHISKAGNSMHIVTMTDGIDSMKFFVFQGGWDLFRDNYKAVGAIGAIPLARFDDGDGGTRFFNDRGQPKVLRKG